MSEPEKPDQPPAPSEPDTFKKRDERNLTLGSRLMLRMLMEHIRIQDAAHGMGSDSSLYKTLTQETMIDAVENVIFFCRRLASKLGSQIDVKTYLLTHEEEDEKIMLKLRQERQHERAEEHKQHVLGIIGAVSDRPGPGECEVCGGARCPSCGQCHNEHKPAALN